VAINPKGIDANYFYGEFLVDSGKPAEAIAYLERSLAAPARPGREIADAGRRDEAKTLLDKVRAQVATR
jgi:Tfp pilus assembly protein PilF